MSPRAECAHPKKNARPPAGIEALLQNYFISAPTLSQLAASASFDCKDELEGHVSRYRDNLEVLLEGLPKAGFLELSRPDGAFYLYCEVSNLVELSGARDSLELCTKILMEAVSPSNRFESGTLRTRA